MWPPWGTESFGQCVSGRGIGGRCVTAGRGDRLPSSPSAAAKIGKEAKIVAWVEFGEWVRAFNV